MYAVQPKGLNLIAHTLGSRLKTGDVVILSEMEHHANIVPWQLICKQIGATIEVIPTLPEGIWTWKHWKNYFGRIGRKSYPYAQHQILWER